jgi:hypothetical protein
MEYKGEPFPLLGFPNESNERNDNVVYRCRFNTARAVIWEDGMPSRKTYRVNIYCLAMTDKIETDQRDRVYSSQAPIGVDDAFEAQMAINYLMQTHLPGEVTDDDCSTYQD